MKQLDEICPYGYGIYVYSPDLLTDFLKGEKCRAKKLITYFDKHKPVFFKAIENGIALPFYPIAIYYYPIFVFINEDYETPPQGWEQVYRYVGFFIQVGNSNRLCFAALEYLQYHKDLIDKQQSSFSKEYPSGPEEILTTCHYAVDVDIPKGDYSFDFIGYKRTTTLDESNLENYGKNYAYGIVLTSKDHKENENLEKGDNETHIFDIEQYDISTSKNSEE